MEQSKTAIIKAAIRYANQLKKKYGNKGTETEEPKKVLRKTDKKD
jgi:hypothetical protein